MKRFFILIFLLRIFTLLGAQENCISTIDSLAKMRENEKRLDSVWRKENIWIQGLSIISNGQLIDTAGIEHPRWAKWNYDLEKYFISQMEYPEHLLKKNRSGYSVVMFSLDTLGLPRAINILTTRHKDFDKEVVRLVNELPHCLPCRDKEGKRMECLYTVYVPFLPQHYRDRVKADSIRKEELKHCFMEWETRSCFKDGNPQTVIDYINERLTYNPELLGTQEEVRGGYRAKIDSYGEIVEVDAFRSCGIQEWDDQVLKIIKGMPRWTLGISYYGKGEYCESSWVIPVIFKKKGNGD